MNEFDVIVIGGGQSGLAVGYYLRRTGLSYLILDNQTEAGGAWLHTWKSLRLFSPAQWSSLPGIQMAGGIDYYPARDVVIEYLTYYEHKYNLSVRRPVEIFQVTKDTEKFEIKTSADTYYAKAIVSATGSFNNPYIPEFAGKEFFKGEIIHSGEYQDPHSFINKKVAIIGEGNSGAQILAEVSKIANTLWVTEKEPRFLPDHIDGRYLFNAATQLYEARNAGKQFEAPSLGDIVMVDAVKEARSRKVLESVRPFQRFTEDGLIWSGGHEEKIDAVIFCTGFRPGLKHLFELSLINADGRIETRGTKAKNIDGLWLAGYGNWTGFASATLIGVGRSAKVTVDEIKDYILAQKAAITA